MVIAACGTFSLGFGRKDLLLFTFHCQEVLQERCMYNYYSFPHLYLFCELLVHVTTFHSSTTSESRTRWVTHQWGDHQSHKTVEKWQDCGSPTRDLEHLELFVCCWEQSKLPQDLCYAVIITLYRNKRGTIWLIQLLEVNSALHCGNNPCKGAPEQTGTHHSWKAPTTSVASEPRGALWPWCLFSDSSKKSAGSRTIDCMWHSSTWLTHLTLWIEKECGRSWNNSAVLQNSSTWSFSCMKISKAKSDTATISQSLSQSSTGLWCLWSSISYTCIREELTNSESSVTLQNRHTGHQFKLQYLYTVGQWSLTVLNLFSEMFLFCPQSVRDSFKTLITELKRIEETSHTASSTGSPVEGSLMAELCKHLCQFAQARQELIDLYLFHIV